MRKIKLHTPNRAKINYLFRNRFEGDLPNSFSGFDQIVLRLNEKLKHFSLNGMHSDFWDGAQVKMVFCSYEVRPDGTEGLCNDIKVTLQKMTTPQSYSWWYVMDIASIPASERAESVTLSIEGAKKLIFRMTKLDQITSDDMVTKAAIGLHIEHNASDMPWRENILRALYADVLDNPTVESALDNLAMMARLAAPPAKS